MSESYPLRTIEVVPFGDQLEFIDKITSNNAQLLTNKNNHRSNRQHNNNYGYSYDHYNNNNNSNNNSNNRGQNKYALAAVTAAAAVHQQQNYLNQQQHHQPQHQYSQNKTKNFDYNDYRNMNRSVMNQKQESSDYSYNQYDFTSSNYRLLNGSSPTVSTSPANNSSTALLTAVQPSALLSHSQPSSSQFINQPRRFEQTNTTPNLSSLSHPLRTNLYDNPLLFNSTNPSSATATAGDNSLLFSSTSAGTGTNSNSATTTSLDSPNSSQPSYRVSNSPPNLLLSTSSNTVASDQIYLNNNSSSSATRGSLNSSNVFSNSPSLMPSTAPTSASGSGWSTSPTGSISTGTPSIMKQSSIWGPSYDSSLISSNTTLTAFGNSSNQTFGSSSMW